MSPDNVDFQIDWKGNEVGPGATGKMLPLPQNVSGDNPIEVNVSSDCGASDKATIFVKIIDIPDPTEPCPMVTTTSATGKHVYNTLVISKRILIIVTVNVKTIKWFKFERPCKFRV